MPGQLGIPEGGLPGTPRREPRESPAHSSTPADSRAEPSLPFAAPSISLPKGGGAIRGIGEKFTANPVTGTGSMTVPIAVSPGRMGFGPELALAYDSGAGNGPFGFGWMLGLPAITRKTDKGLPRYRDAEEGDVFLLSGAEDLVPELGADGRRLEDQAVAPGYTVHRYRPRLEKAFARIERWTRLSDGDVHWRTLSRDNILTLYGRDAGSRVFDPADPRRVFSWLISETRDDRGNAALYDYKSEDGAAVDLSQSCERNRGDRDSPLRTAQCYLKRIRYGNRVPLLDASGARPAFLSATQLAEAKWLFEVVLDYGEHDLDAPRPDDAGTWPCRIDPFSSYRAGFELRTYRLCRRVLMFHHFPDEAGVGADCLVRSTDFAYGTDNPVASFLVSVRATSYRRSTSGYLRKSLPPVELGYSQAVVGQRIEEVDGESLDNLPDGAAGAAYQWVDLDGEGLSGVLAEQAEGWFYKRNESVLTRETATDTYLARLGPAERVPRQPSKGPSGATQRQFLDLAGDGQIDLVTLAPPLAGFHERDDEQGWTPFRAFDSMPNLEWTDPNLRFVDLTGDGHADILITEDHTLTWHASLAEAGFGPSQTLAAAADDERGPRVVFADGTETIALADLSGDGLSDIVRVRNGEVCYWPNLGYGRFGAKVTMDGAPWFDAPDQFDPRRLRLADIDGSGVTDILYLGRGVTRFWFNLSGNGWSEAHELAAFPAVDNLAAVAAVDLLGNGTACLVWSSPIKGSARSAMKYLPLMAAGKPHLLTSTRNNLGAETRLSYAPSTYFYLKDKQAGTPWATRLPFPVHVVERVETLDLIGRNHFVTRYAYHHGHFDGTEREFRGFGLVEQFDTEGFAALSASDAFPDAANVDAGSHVPPVHTKTWFHTGAFLDGERLERQYAREYFHDDVQTLPDTLLPVTLKRRDGSEQPWRLDTDEVREACRALKGALLRQEVYARDGSAAEGLPYSVSERSYAIELLQAKTVNRHAVFFTRPREAITFNYERTLYEIGGALRTDPRIAHTVLLATDGYGNALQSASIAYGRRLPADDALLSAEDRQKQRTTLITYSEGDYTNPLDDAGAWRPPLAAEARTYEILKAAPSPLDRLFDIETLRLALQQASDGSHDLPYEDVAAAGGVEDHPYRRLIEHTRTLYRRDDLSGPLPTGALEAHALPFESYKKALTAGLAQAVYVASGKLSPAALDAALSVEGGYVQFAGDTGWWIPSGRTFFHSEPEATPVQELAFARQHFFLPCRFRDPFQNESQLRYDAYDLLRLETQDAVHNKVTAGERDSAGTVAPRIDYLVLQPTLVTDPNGNRSAVAFDVLGLVAGTAVMGKIGEGLGDSLQGFVADLSQAEIDAFLADPHGHAAALLGPATTRTVYDVDRFFRLGDPTRPAFVATLARERHLGDLAPSAVSPVQIALGYSDGFSREIQKKVQAEPGAVVEGGPDVASRWAGSGWTVFNNKGKPVREYEPFFSASADFEFARTVGVSPILFYDPVGRKVAALYPNRAYEKFRFDPWRQETWDVNDTVLLDPPSDPDIAPYVMRLPPAVYSPTWFQLRTQIAFAAEAQQTWPDSTEREAERDAALAAADHAHTPGLAHLDALGRTFVTVADNGVSKYATRLELDIKGNHRSVGDALGREVVTGAYDMQGGRIHLASMDAGDRWTLNDTAGKQLYAWDSRGHRMRTVHDVLRRPTLSLLRDGNGAEWLVGRTVYGEGSPAPEISNLRGKAVELFDQAGVVTSTAYDFKGNLLFGQRRLATDFRDTIDWSGEVALEPVIYETATRYDALNRPISLSLPAGNTIHPTYNSANLIERVEAALNGAENPIRFVTAIEYDARGQRQRIAYGNGTQTVYRYEASTFRLIGLTTRRAGDGAVVQNIRYTYDPVGNILAVRDDAQQSVYYANQVVSPDATYRYDPLYRLLQAEGREHIGQATRPEPTWDDASRRRLPLPGDGQAMRRYSEQYEYDLVGNLLRLVHQASGGSWTRTYRYDEASLLEPARHNNRLSQTSIGAQLPDAYDHDVHGNFTTMPHLTAMTWDYGDRLQATQQQVVNGAAGERTHYVYDSAGQRVRKVSARADGSKRTERIYLGVIEIYREFEGGGVISLERTSLHVADGAQRIALVDCQTQGGVDPPTPLMRYQLTNHLGSACLELDEDAEIISYEEYHPYGSTSYQAGRTASEVSLKRYRYIGKERDEETGFTYHGARYYAPFLARWTSCDPAGLVDGLNVFAYARSNPILFRDTNGQDVGQARQGMLQSLAKTFDDFESFQDHFIDYYIDTGLEYSEEELKFAWDAAHAPPPDPPEYEWQEHYKGEETWFMKLFWGPKFEKVPLDPQKRKEWENMQVNISQAEVAAANQPSSQDWANMASANAAATEAGADLDMNVQITVPRQIPGAEIEFKRPPTVEPELEVPATKTTADVPSDSEPLAPLRAEVLGGQRVWLVGPEGASSTRAIRINGNTVTYDTRAPAGDGRVRADMKAIANNLGVSDEAMQRGNWWTGTHGLPEGDFMGSLLQPRFYTKERQFGTYYGWNVINVSEFTRFEIQFDDSAATGTPTVYAWCFSSACLTSDR